MNWSINNIMESLGYVPKARFDKMEEIHEEKLDSTIEEFGVFIENLNHQNLLLNDELKESKLTEQILRGRISDIETMLQAPELDQWLDKHYMKVGMFGYKNKRYINKTPYTVFINQLIEPEAYEVKKLYQQLPKPLIGLKFYEKIAELVDKTLHWTSDIENIDKRDYYFTASESIVNKDADCDDHAQVVASLGYPDIGICFGKAGSGYHAFNCFVYKDELWILETNSVRDYNNNNWVIKYSEQDRYKIKYVFTKHGTYDLNTKWDIQFGEVVNSPK